MKSGEAGTSWSMKHSGVMFSGLINEFKQSIFGPCFPLIVCIHGSGYSSKYYDIDGYSLLSRATVMKIPAIALDRPGYGRTVTFNTFEASIEANAKELEIGIDALWRKHTFGSSGIFLIGHAFGAAALLTLAANKPSWPLLGIAVSGIGLHPRILDDTLRVSSLANSAIEWTELSSTAKNRIMFGSDDTFADDMPTGLQDADANVPLGEYSNYFEKWPSVARDVLPQIEVPVHYRQAENDNLWVVDQQQIREFKSLLRHSSLVDAGCLLDVGHCIDFHKRGYEFQQSQLDFARIQSISDRWFIPFPF